MHRCDLDPDPRPLWFAVLVLATCAVAALILTLTGDPAATDPHPDRPSSETCTTADLADGACLTWGDMHYPGVEWHTNTPQ